MGDLGQTENSAQTLDHLTASDPESVINVGDLSYADGYQPRWDTWGRLIAPHTSRFAWAVIEGNHELEVRLLLHPLLFRHLCGHCCITILTCITSAGVAAKLRHQGAYIAWVSRLLLSTGSLHGCVGRLEWLWAGGKWAHRLPSV